MVDKRLKDFLTYQFYMKNKLTDFEVTQILLVVEQTTKELHEWADSAPFVIEDF